MTRNEFVAVCLANAVAPEIALEDEDVREALADRDDSRVMELVRESF